MYTPEVLDKITKLRAKIEANGYNIDECREAVLMMREGRLAAAAASSSAKKRAAKEPVNVDALFDDLDKLT